MARREPVEPVNEFTCILCTPAVTMAAGEYRAHRENVHQLTDHRGKRKAVAHIDADTWFSWSYTWHDPVTDAAFANQYVKQPRHRPMGWGD